MLSPSKKDLFCNKADGSKHEEEERGRIIHKLEWQKSEEKQEVQLKGWQSTGKMCACDQW